MALVINPGDPCDDSEMVRNDILEHSIIGKFQFGGNQDPVQPILILVGRKSRVVRLVGAEVQEAGIYTVVWDGHDGNGNEVASGVYYYKLVAGEHTMTKRMVLLK